MSNHWTAERIADVLDTHKKWLAREPAGERATLRDADLRGADLIDTNLIDANLRDANLSDADLYGASLIDANLSGANLRDADLRGANLISADLSGADLRGAQIDSLAAARLSIVPVEGSFVAWKKCRCNVIVKLRVLSDAKRSNSTGRKCRAEAVEVLEVIGADVGISQHDANTEYRAGEIVRCGKWDEDRWVGCGGGIHFFLTREEAEAY